MKDYDVVKIKETVFLKPLFGDETIEIRAGWEGVIVEYADTHAPLLEIGVWRDVQEDYEIAPGVIRAEPILVHVERTNLEVV
jgi:hypothetical protein